MGGNDWLASHFERHRPHLRAVAYRMLGSLTEADDAVQETWMRLSRSGTEDVENLSGWLADAQSALNGLFLGLGAVALLVGAVGVASIGVTVADCRLQQVVLDDGGHQGDDLVRAGLGYWLDPDDMPQHGDADKLCRDEGGP